MSKKKRKGKKKMMREEEEERKMKMKRGGRKEIKFWEPWWVGRTVDLGSRGPVLSF